MRVLGAWANCAREVLGADYRFKTRFYLDGNRVLYIRGGGDPFLIFEELAQLASAVWVSLTVVPIRPDLASQEEPVSNALPATLRD